MRLFIGSGFGSIEYSRRKIERILGNGKTFLLCFFKKNYDLSI